MKLLLIDDERKLVDSLAHLLKRNGFVVDTALEGESGMEMACTGIYDIIILDRMLPQKDGLALLKEFRELGFETPVIMLTAKDTPEDRAEGLNAGADDYLLKPFYSIELLARLQALARRRNKTLGENILTFDLLKFTPSRCEVVNDGKTVQLTLKESQLLELLIRNHDRVVTKEQIIQKVWGYFSEADFSTVNLYIHYLRKKLGLTNLKTIWGVGYLLQSKDKMVENTSAS